MKRLKNITSFNSVDRLYLLFIQILCHFLFELDIFERKSKELATSEFRHLLDFF